MCLWHLIEMAMWIGKLGGEGKQDSTLESGDNQLVTLSPPPSHPHVPK